MKQWTDRESEAGFLLEFTLCRGAIVLSLLEFSACGRPEWGFVFIMVTKQEQVTTRIENDQPSRAP